MGWHLLQFKYAQVRIGYSPQNTMHLLIRTIRNCLFPEKTLIIICQRLAESYLHYTCCLLKHWKLQFRHFKGLLEPSERSFGKLLELMTYFFSRKNKMQVLKLKA